LLQQQQGDVIVILHAMSEADLCRVLTFEGTLIGSDGIALAGKPHPRIAGTFPRVLGRYCRDRGLLSMEESLRRMTALAASRFGLRDRGSIRPEAFADLVIFDPDEIHDRATFESPLLPPTGITQVIVNGEVTVNESVLTGTRAGRVIS
jgi:N-acyl-D-amino-acid deacylase